MIIEKVDNKNPPLKISQTIIPDTRLFTPLHLAAKNGHIEVCRLIISHLEDKNPKSSQDITPLHFAAKAENPNGLNIYRLIMNEVDEKNPKDKLGNTPLHIAAGYGNFEVSKLIVESVDEKNPADEDRTTPLHLAAGSNIPEICRLILAVVDDMHPVDRQGETPLDWAREQFGDEVLQELEQLWLEEEINRD